MAKLQSFVNFCKKPGFLLTLVLGAFFLKGILLSASIPMLKGQDESRHYITVQHLAHSGKKQIGASQRTDIEGLEKYIGSEEFEETVKQAKLSDPVFTDGYEGENESTIKNSYWKKGIETDKASVINKKISLYHETASYIEKILSDMDIFFRFYALRIFSVLLGTLTLLIAYFLAKAVGFPDKISLLLVALISFQPAFSSYLTNINYDALLILFFALFMLGGVLFLRDGLNRKNAFLLSVAFILGIFTKATAVIFGGPLAFLFLFYLYTKIKEKKLRAYHIVAILAIFILLVGIAYSQFGSSVFTPPTDKEMTLKIFLEENYKRIERVSSLYWGYKDGIPNRTKDFVEAIWFVKAISVIGILLYLVSWKNPAFLPQKRHVFFLMIMLFSLQIGILFTNWRLTAIGSETLLTSPGRYFLPNLPAHLLVMFAGLGTILRKQFLLELFLMVWLLLMFAFQAHVIFNVIIPKTFF